MKITDKQRLDFIGDLIINQGLISYESDYNHLNVSLRSHHDLKLNTKYKCFFIVFAKIGDFKSILAQEETFEKAIDAAIRAMEGEHGS